MKVDVDDLTGSTTREVIDLNDRPVKGKGMTPSLTVLDGKKKVIATYSLPSKSILMKNNGNCLLVTTLILIHVYFDRYFLNKSDEKPRC